MSCRKAGIPVLAGLIGIAIGVALAPYLSLSSLSDRLSEPTIFGEEAEPGTPGPSIAPGSVHVEDRFATGKSVLTWRPFPGFSPDSLKPVRRPDAPDGDGWVGVVTNETFGGFASLAYAGEETLSDYSVEAWVYVEVVPGEQGPIHGIAVRVDPEGGRFYRLAAQFGAEARLTLAYVGRDVNNFPVYLKQWSADEIPGGVPSASGWHRMKLRAEGDRFWAYWDDQELPGSPATDDRIKAGYFGVYANFTGARQVAQTFVDGIVVQGDRWGKELLGIRLRNTASYRNPASVLIP